VPILCSNVRLRENGQRSPPWACLPGLEPAGVRVALFSLLGPEELQTVTGQSGMEFLLEDPFDAPAACSAAPPEGGT